MWGNLSEGTSLFIWKVWGKRWGADGNKNMGQGFTLIMG